MSATHHGRPVQRFVDDTGKHRLTVVARDDGAFGYVEEVREVHVEADEDYEAFDVWDVVQLSGVFSDRAAALTEARKTTRWLQRIKV